MIVKNGEILAIDHIAHDNTLSGNGTSAKPVGLSQSTKDLIDSKVKKTDFETYKSSAANQISNINTKITTDESDFNTFKSSAHNEIARVDGRIDATNTNLENNYYDITETYNRTEVDEKFANFGGFKFRDPDPTKNNEPKLEPDEVEDPKAIYLTQPAGATQYLQWIWNTEVTPNVWKCIGDTTMDLSDYAKTVDVVQSANNNVQAVKDWADDKFETKQDFESVIAGYYTKGAADDLLNTKIDNTTFEAYQQTVSDTFDSVDSDFENTSAWANNTFTTKTYLNDVQSDLEGEINNLESKIERDINNASADIINKIDTTSAYLDDKIEAVIDTLEDDYYTSKQIDTILAASGSYYTQSQVDEKLEEYAKSTDLVPITENIESVSAKFDNYYTKTDIDDNFVTNTTFNILDDFVDDIDKDLDTVSADIDTLSGKVNGLHNTVIETSDTVIATPTTKPDGTISYSLSAIGGGSQSNYLWKPTVDESGNIEWTISVTTDTPASANIKGPQGPQGIQGISGTPGKDGENGKDGITPKLKIDENDIWNVSYDNEATWTSLGVSATGPKGETGAQGPQGIQGIQGVSGTPGKDGENGITPHIGNNNHWFIDDYDTGVSATGPQGPAGTNGTNGKDGTDGKNGVSPTVTTATIEGGNRVTFTYGEGSTEYIDVMSGVPGLPGVSPTVIVTNIPADPSDPDHKNGGTEITITDATSTNKFSAWNGNDGTMADAPNIEGKNGISAVLAGSTYEVGLSGAFYNAITSISSKLDESDFTTYTATTAPDAFQAKGNYLSANALNGYATESWVEDQGYLKQNDIAGKADKTELETVSGEIVEMIPSLNGYATEQYVQGASAGVTAWVGQQGFLKNSDLTDYATKSYANEASANALSQAESWVETEGYLKSVSVATNSSINGTGTTNNPLSLKTSAENALKDVANKVAKPDTTQTELNNNYLIYSTLTDPAATTGWMPLSANYYSKSEADGRYQKKEDMSSYLTTAQYETDSAKYVLTGDILTAANNKLTGIKIGSTDYTVPTTDLSNYYTKSETSATGELNTEFAKKLDSTIAESTYQTKADMSAYLPLIGGTVTGQTTIIGSAFDTFELKRSDQQGSTGIIGINGAGGMSFKIVNGNNNTQLNIAPNATMDKRFSIGDTPHQPAAYFIPAVTATTTDGLTDDGILHIILES